VVGPEEEKDCSEFILYKRQVHHRALDLVLESIKIPSKIGSQMNCCDGVKRLLFPGVYILSLDFEEA
jgi:hypothetical protein